MKKFGIFLIVIALAMLVSCASASMDLFDTKKIDMGGYTVTVPDVTGINYPQVKSVYATITQGETDWFSTDISGYYTQFHVDLNWGDVTDSLRLKVYSPDGYTFGYYYDSFDGSNNGRIELNINNNNGIAEGTWYCEVYGYDVTGTEDYTI
ncbi:hypothetical protein [Methanolacinia petrolearia]|nr:hypothetical protein [Methanolacinia petrolearia]